MLKYSLYDNMNKHLRLLFSATNVIVASNSIFVGYFVPMETPMDRHVIKIMMQPWTYKMQQSLEIING